MAVYPFYIKTRAEGRNTPIAGGTRRKDGSMETTIYQRDRGSITDPYKIIQRSNGATCMTEVYFQGELIHTHETEY